MHTMNDNELEKRFRDEAANFSLSLEEKARMRRVVSAYAAMKPVRRRVAARATGSRWYALILSPRMAVGALVVVLVASSAGVSYAAESALPGDLLYTVKVKVNEPVAQALSTTPHAKAQTAAKLAHRRLDEAAKLAAQGRLGTSTRERLQEDFEGHIAEAVTASAQVHAAADVEITAAPATSTLARLDELLSEEEDKLARLSASTTELAPVIASVKEQRIRVAQSRDREDDEQAIAAASMGTEGAKNEEMKQGKTRVADAKRKEVRARDQREEVRRRPTATFVASTAATTTATRFSCRDTGIENRKYSCGATTTVDESTTTESFIDATIRTGEDAGSMIGESVWSYFIRWSDDGKPRDDGEQNDRGKKGPQVQLKGSIDNNVGEGNRKDDE